MDKAEPGSPFKGREVGAIAGIGQGVQHGDRIGGVPTPPVVDEIGSDEARSAGDENSSHVCIVSTGHRG